MATEIGPALIKDEKAESFVKRTTFYVNREWEAGAKTGQGTYIRGHMYVESLEPRERTQRWPIILIHGDYHSSQIWLTKPDGDPGWASSFVDKGFHVYLVDLPGTGKSNNLTGEAISYAEIRSIKATQIEREMTATERFNHIDNLRWPTALKHDKWPGTGIRGDDIFGRYCASLTSLVFSPEERQTLAQNALKRLLKIAGKSILIGEGTGATASWLAADVEPTLVAGVVAVEPPGPPFCDPTIERQGKRKFDSFTSFNPNRLKYGLSTIPLTFSPAVRPEPHLTEDPTGWHPLDLALFVHTDTGKTMVLQCNSDNMPSGFHFLEQITHQDGAMQVRKLTNLSKVRHVLFTGEASSHSAYDGSTLHFMQQAGLTVDCGFLERYKTNGNGHLMFLETNSDEIAAHIMRWIQNRAGQVDGQVPMSETGVTTASTAVSSSEVIDVDQQFVKSLKRARHAAPRAPKPSSASASQSHLIDLTDKPQLPTDSGINNTMQTISKEEHVLSSALNSISQGQMPPPPLPDWTTPPKTPARGPATAIKTNALLQRQAPMDLELFASLTNSHSGYVPVPCSNSKPAQANSQEFVPKQPKVGGFGSHEPKDSRSFRGDFDSHASYSSEDTSGKFFTNYFGRTFAQANSQPTNIERNRIQVSGSHESKRPQPVLNDLFKPSLLPTQDSLQEVSSGILPATGTPATLEATGFKRNDVSVDGNQEPEWLQHGHSSFGGLPTYPIDVSPALSSPLPAPVREYLRQAGVKNDENGKTVGQESGRHQASHDNMYTDCRFDLSVPRNVRQYENETTRPFPSFGNSSLRAASQHTASSQQQQPASWPSAAVASDTTRQDNPYIWSMQNERSASSFSQIPRSIPEEQDWKCAEVEEKLPIDGMPTDLDTFLSIHNDDDDEMRGIAY